MAFRRERDESFHGGERRPRPTRDNRAGYEEDYGRAGGYSGYRDDGPVRGEWYTEAGAGGPGAYDQWRERQERYRVRYRPGPRRSYYPGGWYDDRRR